MPSPYLAEAQWRKLTQHKLFYQKSWLCLQGKGFTASVNLFGKMPTRTTSARAGFFPAGNRQQSNHITQHTTALVSHTDRKQSHENMTQASPNATGNVTSMLSNRLTAQAAAVNRVQQTFQHTKHRVNDEMSHVNNKHELIRQGRC